MRLLHILSGCKKTLAAKFNLDGNGSFDEKKKITSAMRRLAPIGLGTAIVFSANFNAIRHIIQMRTAKHAEVEMRIVFGKVGEIMVKKFPLLFQDFTRTEDGTWKSEYPSRPY